MSGLIINPYAFASPPTPYLYYRLLITARQGTGYVEISEFQLYETVGGANAATSGTGTASSQLGASWSGDKAFDGNDQTRWISNSPMPNPSWLRYQLPSAIAVAEYGVFMSNDNTPPSLLHPTAWTFQGSDNNSTWVTLDTRTGQTFSKNQNRKFVVGG